jgi:hypothetical protein
MSVEGEQDPRQQWSQALGGQIASRADGGIRLPVHVLARMTTLLYPAEPRHVDVSLSFGERMRLSGHVRVWTDSLLLLAVLQDVKTSAHHRFDDGHRDAKVSITVLPRSALQQVSLEPDEEPWVNGGDVWQEGAAGGDWSFPQYGRVTLRYAGITEPIALPSAPTRPEGLDNFLPTLIDDLTRSTSR